MVRGASQAKLGSLSGGPHGSQRVGEAEPSHIVSPVSNEPGTTQDARDSTAHGNDSIARGPGVLRADFGRGFLIDGKYEVLGVLGAGGMGTVLEARHKALDALVAIKVLDWQSKKQPDRTRRFLREARALARTAHENVVRVFDLGTLDSGAPFMVMERLFGTDLEQLVKTRGPLPCNEAVEYVLAACKGLAHAHAQGVIHRDLKPANLFLSQPSQGVSIVKVLDFGLSKWAPGTGASSDELTQENALLGSPQYMSPEQLRSSRDVDERTDIWAIGVILQRLVTAQHPFEAPTFAGLAVAIASDPPDERAMSARNVPAGLRRVILRCLEKDPKRRFASVRELEGELQSILKRPSAMRRARPLLWSFGVAALLLSSFFGLRARLSARGSTASTAELSAGSASAARHAVVDPPPRGLSETASGVSAGVPEAVTVSPSPSATAALTVEQRANVRDPGKRGPARPPPSSLPARTRRSLISESATEVLAPNGAATIANPARSADPAPASSVKPAVGAFHRFD